MLPYHVFVITSRCGHLQKMAKAQLSLETPYGPSQTNQTNDALGFLSLLLCSGVKISDRFMVQNIPFYFCLSSDLRMKAIVSFLLPCSGCNTGKTRPLLSANL